MAVDSLKKGQESQAVVAHAFNPSTGRGRQISEFDASLVYKVSSRTARATQRNPVSKKQTNKKKNKTKKQQKKTTSEDKAAYFIYNFIAEPSCYKGHY